MSKYFFTVVGLCFLWNTGAFAVQENHDGCDKYFSSSGHLVSAICYYKNNNLVNFKEIENTAVEKRHKLYDLRIEKHWNSETGKLYSEVHQTPEKLFAKETIVEKLFDREGNEISSATEQSPTPIKNKKSDYL